jgi:hypothetical protein
MLTELSQVGGLLLPICSPDLCNSNSKGCDHPVKAFAHALRASTRRSLHRHFLEARDQQISVTGTKFCSLSRFRECGLDTVFHGAANGFCHYWRNEADILINELTFHTVPCSTESAFRSGIYLRASPLHSTKDFVFPCFNMLL